MEAESSQVATALLTEHLEYTPLSLIDDIINAVNTIAYQGIESLESALHSQPPQALGFRPNLSEVRSDASAELDYPQARQEIEEGLHKLETLLGSAVDKNFDKFEIYVLRNVLAVPHDLAKWVRLSHYENLTYPLPTTSVSPDSVQMLRRKVIASQTVSAALTTEHTRNKVILDQLRQIATATSSNDLLPNYAFLTENPAASMSGPSPVISAQQSITTNTNFALSQLPALKSIIADLRPRLASLKETQLSTDSAKDERREERRAYIEQRTKSYLHRNGQTATHNAVLASGRNFDTDELDAVEKIANIFGPS